MKNLTRMILVGIALVGFAGSASARTMPAEIGRAPTASQSSCFTFWNGAVGNSGCSGHTAVWEIPMVTDNDGSKTVYSTYQTQNVSSADCAYVCQYVYVEEPISGYFNSSGTCNQTPHGWMRSQVNSGTISLPANGNAYYRSVVPKNMQVLNITFNP